MSAPKTALRLYANDPDASCLETFEISRELRDLAPPAGPLWASDAEPASRLRGDPPTRRLGRKEQPLGGKFYLASMAEYGLRRILASDVSSLLASRVLLWVYSKGNDAQNHKKPTDEEALTIVKAIAKMSRRK